MVLTLSNGGVYFFQAGTEELVNEWVSTCNYWAARTSKEPLAGGVSNMEYGWNRIADPLNHEHSMSSESLKDIDPSDSMSVRSVRSARSKLRWKDAVEKVYINDWKPPLPPMVSSVHDEESQMEALQKHVLSMKKDLKRHNELRQPMAALVCSLDFCLTESMTDIFNSTKPALITRSSRKLTGRINPNISSRRL
jgi:hypothetical protein